VSRAHDRFEAEQDAEYDRLRTGRGYHAAQRAADARVVAGRRALFAGAMVDHRDHAWLRDGIVLAPSEAPIEQLRAPATADALRAGTVVAIRWPAGHVGVEDTGRLVRARSLGPESRQP
jgi:hypothetical protein